MLRINPLLQSKANPKKRFPSSDADVLGQNFAKNQQPDGHARGKGRPLLREELPGQHTVDERAEGVGDGVKSQDGRDAFVESVAALREQLPRARRAGLEGLDLSPAMELSSMASMTKHSAETSTVSSTAMMSMGMMENALRKKRTVRL